MVRGAVGASGGLRGPEWVRSSERGQEMVRRPEWFRGGKPDGGGGS